MPGKIRIGVDTGGTFTDLVLWDGRCLHTFKLPSTPDDFARGVLEGVTALLADRGPRSHFQLTHSTTVATNALLERKGARTALVTTAGFADVLEIGRQDRPSLYDLAVRRPQPLVPRHLRTEVGERVSADGQVIRGLCEDDIRRCMASLEDQGIESLAVCLLFSFLRPAHERRLARAARACGWHVSASSDIVAEFREYERTSTTVVNAYVAPGVQRYLRRLDRALRRQGCRSWRVMQSNGGSLAPATAGREAVRTLLSGPAAGVIGALAVAHRALGTRRGEAPNVLTFDMGGTSTDVSLLRGEPRVTTESTVAGYPVRIPMMDIHTVGAGGGSVAYVDAGGALHVGPRSAGARPGPACYGEGDEITVTDANLVLERIDPSRFLGGRKCLDAGRARAAVDRLAKQLGSTRRRTARAVIRVVNASMERALRVISTQRGHDPRYFTLVCFGGAGGLHAAELSMALRISRVLVPREPGVLSAIGALSSDVVRDLSRTLMRPGTAPAARVAARELDALVRRLRGLMRREHTSTRLILERTLDLRYRGQSYELTVPWKNTWDSTAAAFHAAHAARYGHCDPGAALEIVTVRARAIAPTRPPRQPRVGRSKVIAAAARLGVSGRKQVFERSARCAGNRIRGPALVVEAFSTTWVPTDWTAKVDDWGNLIMESKTVGGGGTRPGAALVGRLT